MASMFWLPACCDESVSLGDKGADLRRDADLVEVGGGQKKARPNGRARKQEGFNYWFMMLHGSPTRAPPPSRTASTEARRISDRPFMNQICASPVELLCQRISALPS